MFTIRKNVFETNSSSTHSICISKEKPVEKKEVVVRLGEYGWENNCYDVLDYFYTAVCLYEREEELEKILKAMGIKLTVINPNAKVLGEYYIDHYEDLKEFIDAALNNVDLLLRILFSGGDVYTGNDNEDYGDAMCRVAEGEYYDNDNECYVPHPSYNTEKYDYFYKGN